MDVGVWLGLLLLAFFVWGVPIIFVVSDPIIGKKEKAVWVIAIGLASWVAWLVYRYVAPVVPRKSFYALDEERQIPPSL